ncbi:hypothetical protein EBS67_06995 [bacterium]|nr:hypothetical protein [bacterium]NBT60269.1 hypothetical protein [Planctomycetia bacterium]
MAKHVILESYSFTPSTRTIVVNGKYIRAEQLLLVTNVTRNIVIYNFSDPDLGFTACTPTATLGVETTTIVLAYNTTAHSSTDKLSILFEETYSEITPSETLMDPVGKMRTSTPQSLIDTDFEYGTQPTKWESISTLNLRPSAFYDATVPLLGISNITSSGTTVTVTTTSTLGLAVGTPFFIIGTYDTANADGWWVVDTISTNVSFTYRTFVAPTQISSTLFDSSKTYVFAGTFYTGSSIPIAANAGTAMTLNGTILTCTTTNEHGLNVGNHVFIVGTTGVTGVNGTWAVATTPTKNTFTISTALTGTITTTTTSLYSRTQGYVTHRAFDGGVQFSNQLASHGYQVTRQTRRYFRYQSGKGIQFSTGTIFKPSLQVDTITSSGTTVTITTKYPHGLAPGAYISVSGCIETAYNGIFLVATVANVLTLTYTAATTPSAATATSNATSGIFTVAPSSWYGSANRVGMFDYQNGFFFEFDGQTLYVVKRSSTTQLSGTIAVANGSSSIIGTGTAFATQLKPGDYVVIRGMSYLVSNISTDTAMNIYPEYRGTTIVARGILSKTLEVRVPQSQWNIDKADGTGYSGFTLDLSKMQMFYIDYSWYGAGAIRFGFKNNRGEVMYVHRMVNNNVNTEAYMRSGNLPARYEVNTIAPYTYLTQTLANTALSGSDLFVSDTSRFPASGTVIVYNNTVTTGAIEYITYSGKTTTSLNITGRAAAGGNGSAQTFTYSAVAPQKVELYSPAQASTISHWGSAVSMDGRYDDDKSLVFAAGVNTPAIFNSTIVRRPLIALRVSPSVDNGFIGLLGQREIVNRMQLILRQMDVYTTLAFFKIDLVLNGTFGGTLPVWTAVGGSSLAQVAYFTNTDNTVLSGETILTFFTNLGGVTQQELALVRDMGNSILGGGNTNSLGSVLNKFPDGPDVIAVCVAPVISTANASIITRLSWTEAQA